MVKDELHEVGWADPHVHLLASIAIQNQEK